VYCEIDGLPAELDPLDLSSAGLFVETPQPVPVDTEVEVFVRVGELRISATGTVVKSVSCTAATALGKKPGYALLFTNLDEANRKRLVQSVEELGRSHKRPAHERSHGSERAVASAGTSTSERAAAGSGRPSAMGVARASRAASKKSERPKAPVYDPAELTLLAALQVELEQLAPKTTWAVLGVSQGADHTAVKAAFFQASKRYHPHLYARYAHPEIKRVVTELFIAHKRAYTTLLKPGKSLRASRA
jgi:hypothetical protein